MPSATATPVQLTEAIDLAPAPAGARRFRVRIIEADVWGSSGYYSTEVLESAARDKVFAAGTQIYIDHPTESEKSDRPERSIRDLAGKLVTDAVFEADGLYADIEVYPSHAALIEEAKDDIGMSIRATAEAEHGEAAGRSGLLITRFHEAVSVDFVTRAGAGGKVVSLIESARANARAISRGVEEATVNDRREVLVSLVRDAHGSDDRWAWVRDFDDTTVWFEVEGDTYQQTYTSDADGVPTALTGDRTEVRAVTQYVPVSPAGRSTTQESKEDTMPQIEETRLRQLEEAAGRVSTLESERDAAVQRAETAESERDAARTQLAERDRRDAATAVIDQVVEATGVQFDALQRRGLLAEIPTTEAGELDADAFKETVEKAATSLTEAVGGVRGFGPTGVISESDKAFDELFNTERKGA